MILYLDETKDSRKACKLVQKAYGDIPFAPASGSQLPELVVDGKSYIGLRCIKEKCTNHLSRYNHWRFDESMERMGWNYDDWTIWVIGLAGLALRARNKETKAFFSLWRSEIDD